MKNLDFEWLTDEFMLYCRSTQLREKTMSSYEQTLHLFGRWLADELKIYTVDKITENVIRKYIDDLMTRGKYTFYVNDLSKKKNYYKRDHLPQEVTGQQIGFIQLHLTRIECKNVWGSLPDVC